MSTIVGIFEDQESAETAIDRLDALEVDEGSIHVLSRNETGGGGSLLGSVARAVSAGNTPLESRLTQLGLSRDEAAFYEQELGDEGVIVAVEADDDLDPEILAVMREANGTVRS